MTENTTIDRMDEAYTFRLLAGGCYVNVFVFTDDPGLAIGWRWRVTSFHEDRSLNVTVEGKGYASKTLARDDAYLWAGARYGIVKPE
jgi:hypothetical protein